MKMYAIWLGILLGVTVAAANAAEVDGSADGYDYKVYSAASCGAAIPAATEVFKNGGIGNNGTAVNNITCPVILDRNTSAVDSYYMRVWRAPGAGKMTCYLVTQYGSSVTTTTRDVTTTGPNIYLYFSGGGGYADSAVLGCGVPAKVSGGTSGIKHYQVYEY